VRFRVAAVSLVAVFGLALAWIAAAPADNPVLLGSVGPGFVISLTDAAGNDFKHLDAGTYTIKVDDKADIHNFHLTGPGVDVTTTVEFVGQMEWSVTLKDGTYQFQCDPHSTLMRGTFTVGNAATTTTNTTPPPPKPTVRKVSGRVGPGAAISFPRTARAGKTQITIRDLSASDNFHLVGPGVNKRTAVKAKQTLTWTVTLRRGTYVFRSDAHAKLRGKTRVS
jgi:plastocyanin